MHERRARVRAHVVAGCDLVMVLCAGLRLDAVRLGLALALAREHLEARGGKLAVLEPALLALADRDRGHAAHRPDAALHDVTTRRESQGDAPIRRAPQLGENAFCARRVDEEVRVSTLRERQRGHVGCGLGEHDGRRLAKAHDGLRLLEHAAALRGADHRLRVCEREALLERDARVAVRIGGAAEAVDPRVREDRALQLVGLLRGLAVARGVEPDLAGGLRHVRRGDRERLVSSEALLAGRTTGVSDGDAKARGHLAELRR